MVLGYVVKTHPRWMYWTTAARKAAILPAPALLTVSGTGSGSLPANTYCFVIVGQDSQSTPGLTNTCGVRVEARVRLASPFDGEIELTW